VIRRDGALRVISRDSALRAREEEDVGARRCALRALGLLAWVWLAACGPERYLPVPDVVARIAGEEVRYAEFERHLETNLGESGGALASEALSALLDQFLTERLLARSAVEQGLARPGDSPAAAVEGLLGAEPAPLVTETAISAYYREHLSDFRVPEQIELRVVKTEERADAERARRELAAGADFGAVARRLSVDPTAERGGEQGALGRESLPAALAETLFALGEGAISEIVASPDGFRIFQVARKIPERTRSLEEAREEILAKLAGARADRDYAQLVAEARSRYAVEVYERNLPFAYRGAFPVSRPYENR
jgi:peptidyl-prolyl cis-trans isomerase C